MMTACLRAADRVVLFVGVDLVLDDAGEGQVLAGDGWTYRAATGDLVLEKVANVPAAWIGGGWSLSEAGDWEVHDHAVVDAAEVAATRDLAEARSAKLSALAAYRYDREVGGTLVGGVEVRTDRESQALLTGAAVAAMLNSEYEIAWKAVAGWVTLDAASIIGLASAVRAHAQSCFDRERKLTQEIEAAMTVEELQAVDLTIGWPAVGS